MSAKVKAHTIPEDAVEDLWKAYEPIWKSAAQSLTTPNQMWKRKFILWSCKSVTRFNKGSCISSLLSIKKLQCLLFNACVWSMEGFYTKYGPAPVSIRHLSVFKSLAVAPHWHTFHGLPLPTGSFLCVEVWVCRAFQKVSGTVEQDLALV